MQLLVVIPIADPRFTPIVRDEIRTLIGSSQHRVVVEHLATGPRWIDSPQAEAEAGAAIVRAYRDLRAAGTMPCSSRASANRGSTSSQPRSTCR